MEFYQWLFVFGFITDCYHPPTELWESNVFTGVCHSVRRGDEYDHQVSLAEDGYVWVGGRVSVPEVGGYVQVVGIPKGRGWICLGDGYPPPGHGTGQGWATPTNATKTRTVGKRPVRFLLECFLFNSVSSQQRKLLLFPLVYTESNQLQK